MRAVSSSNVENEREMNPRGFSTTRWSMIVHAPKGDEEMSRQALTHLCRTYWRPVFLFVWSRNYSCEEAKDLTQEFFAMIVETNWLRHADQRRGRFRALLLTSLQNFLRDQEGKKSAEKRGGGRVTFVTWDDWMAEEPSHLSVSAKKLESLPAEHRFDLRWGATVVEKALRRLGDECEKKRRRRLFSSLSRHIVAERSDLSYVTLGAELGVSEGTVRRQLENLRRRYRWLLRDEISQTVDGGIAEVDDEIRHLCAALGTTIDVGEEPRD